MDELLKEIEDTSSEASIVDFEFDSDDDKENDLEFIQAQKETKEEIKEEPCTQLQQQPLEIKQPQQTYIQNYESLIKQELMFQKQKSALKLSPTKSKQSRECNLKQSLQILKTFGQLTHRSYKTLEQKKQLLFQKIINGVQKWQRQ